MIRQTIWAVLAVGVFFSGGGCASHLAYHEGRACTQCPGDAGGADTCCDDDLGCRRCGQHGHSKPKLGPWLRRRMSCGSGCGAIYWGEWTSDPPDDCDPCNRHGDWVGPRHCKPRFRTNPLLFLKGQPCGDQCDCDECAHPTVQLEGAEATEWIDAAESDSATRGDSSYYSRDARPKSTPAGTRTARTP